MSFKLICLSIYFFFPLFSICFHSFIHFQILFHLLFVFSFSFIFLKQLVDELAKEFPGLAKTIIEERDSFLAHSLWSNAQVIEPGCNMVGVVGIGHLQGIRNKWNEVHLIDIKELSL